jgi:hypothetical protein
MKDSIMLFGIILALFLYGCASKYQLVKYGATQQEVAKDNYECERDARQSGYFGGGIVGEINMRNFFERCLAVKGYQKIKIE